MSSSSAAAEEPPFLLGVEPFPVPPAFPFPFPLDGFLPLPLPCAHSNIERVSVRDNPKRVGYLSREL